MCVRLVRRATQRCLYSPIWTTRHFANYLDYGFLGYFGQLCFFRQNGSLEPERQTHINVICKNTYREYQFTIRFTKTHRVRIRLTKKLINDKYRYINVRIIYIYIYIYIHAHVSYSFLFLSPTLCLFSLIQCHVTCTSDAQLCVYTCIHA